MNEPKEELDYEYREPLVSERAEHELLREKRELRVAEAKWCLREIERCEKHRAEINKRLSELDAGAEPKANDPHTGSPFIDPYRKCNR